MYSTENPWIFIHIPRTSGVALYASLGHYPNIVVTRPQNRHIRAVAIPFLVGEHLWASAYRFSIMRNPFEIAESDYRLTLYQTEFRGAIDGVSAEWDARLARMIADRRFERFLDDEYLGEFSGVLPGGFWRTWCCDEDGREMGVQVSRFESLATTEGWAWFLSRLGLPIETPRLRLNSAPQIPASWTKALINRFAERCCYDLDKFGYQSPMLD